MQRQVHCLEGEKESHKPLHILGILFELYAQKTCLPADQGKCIPHGTNGKETMVTMAAPQLMLMPMHVYIVDMRMGHMPTACMFINLTDNVGCSGPARG